MATNSSRESASSSKFVYPPPIVLLGKRDFKPFNDILLSIGQRVNMTEELVYSISTKNPDLQKTYDLRFAGVDSEKRPPLTGYEASDLLSPSKTPSSSSSTLPSQTVRQSGNTSDQGSRPIGRGGRRQFTRYTGFPRTSSQWHDDRTARAAFADESDNEVLTSRAFETPLQPTTAARSVSSPGSIDTSQLPAVPQALKDFLGITRSDEKKIHTSEVVFINILTWRQEHHSKRKARADLWIWMKSCLYLDITKNVRGMFFSAFEGVPLNDICMLLTKLRLLCTRPNIVAIARSVAEFFLKKEKVPLSPSQFYVNTEERADDINQSLEALERERGNTLLTGGFRISPFVSACLTLNSISKERKYEHLMFSLAEKDEVLATTLESTKGFIKYLDDFQQNLENIRGEEPTLSASLAVEKRPQDACWRNFKGVPCRLDCKFKHYKPNISSGDLTSLGKAESSSRTSTSICFRCGSLRTACPDISKCSAISSTCTGCKKTGHVVAVCKARKASFSALRANFAKEMDDDSEEPMDQRELYSEVVDFGDDADDFLEEYDEQCNMCVEEIGEGSGFIISRTFENAGLKLSTNDVPPNAKSLISTRDLTCNFAKVPQTEGYTTFISDTGTNVSITNKKVDPARSYFEPSSINLAGSDSKILSHNKSDLSYQLKTGHGLEVSRVVNSASAQNLLSVPNLTKAGLTFVYDETEMRVFQTKGLNIAGELIDREDKCQRTGLYPWTMKDNPVTEEGSSGLLFCANAIAKDNSSRTSSERLSILRDAFAAFITPFSAKKLMANLARAYYDKAGDENSMRHEALCHLSAKTINTVFPGANYPLGGCGCQDCVDSKAHRIPKPARLDTKTSNNMKPGERCQADFQGPFAGACGGKRYALEFIDVPSGYGDTYPCKATTDFYQVFPVHWKESCALSGNRLRKFETDSDSVFASKESQKIYQEKVVSHSAAAPYEHCPYIEGQNRIRFEAVSAMMKRANAKSPKWSLARKHFVFTMNNIRVVKLADGSLISRRNIFENNTTIFNPKFFAAFGTRCQVQIPAGQRDGGKGPTQLRTFDGVVVGYMKSGLGYLVEHSGNMKIYNTGFTMTTIFPGDYPWWKDTNDDCPKNFFPTLEAAVDAKEWEKFKFDELESSRALDIIESTILPTIKAYAKLNGEVETGITKPLSVVSDLSGSEFRRAEEVPKSVTAVEEIPSLSTCEPKSSVEEKQKEKSVEMTIALGDAVEVVQSKALDLPVTTDLSEPLSKQTLPGELVCSKSRKPKRNQRIYVLEREGDDGTGKWIVIEADVLPRVNSPNATKVGHERCANAKDPLDIWDVPRDNIDFTLESAIIRCDQSNDHNFAGVAIVPHVVDVLDSTREQARMGLVELKAFSAESRLLFTQKPITLPPPQEWNVDKHPYSKDYISASDLEFAQVEANKTWILVDIDKVPKGHKIIPTKMIFSDKIKDEACVKPKARLVAQGNRQAPNSYGETHAGVMDINGFRLQLAELIQDDTIEHAHWDSSNAYLNAVLHEEVYCAIPPRYKNRYPGKCWRLLKALYGLRQAGFEWKMLVNKIMKLAGAVANPKDLAVFQLTKGNDWVRTFTEVDDFFVFWPKQSRYLRDVLWNTCTQNIREINDLGPLSWVLKCKIDVNHTTGVLTMSQGGFAREMIARFGFENIKHADTPAFDKGEDSKMTAEDLIVSPENSSAIKDLPIREVIGCLWWLVRMTRLDMNLATQQASRYQDKPSMKLWRWLLRMVGYLAKEPDRGLVFRKSSEAQHRVTYCDASLGDLPDSKSTLGLAYLISGCSVHWNCCSSSRICFSSCEAEAHALVKAWKFDQWVKLLLFYMHGTHLDGLPTVVKEDNMSTIALTSEHAPKKRARHYGMEWDAVCEAVQNKEIQLVWTDTNEQWADILTKPLSKAKFEQFRNALMGNL